MIRLTAILLVLSTSVAYAQPPTAPPVVITHEGTPGLWFPEEAARRMLEAWRERILYLDRISNLEDQLANRENRVALLRESLELSDHSISLLRQSNARLARVARPRWWTNPALWLVVGLLAGGTLVTINNRR